MKKLFIFIFMILFVVGCTNKKDLMKEYGTDYYKKYMTGVTGLTEARIKLEDLEKMNKVEGKEVYDLSSFKRCDKDSYISLKLENKKIVSYEFNLIC